MGNYIKKIRKYGFVYSWNIILNYKIEPIIAAVFKLLFSSTNIKDAIIFSSHNDFDMNAGTLYDFMVSEGLNKSYKLIWFVDKVRPVFLPENVIQLSERGISLKRYYWRSSAKYIFYDDTFIEKWKQEQVTVYLGHATRAMKNCRGLVTIPQSIDYVCSSSEENDRLMSEVYVCAIEKMLHTGFPVTDLLYGKWNELDKIQHSKNYEKIIIWMPTFRKSAYKKDREDTSVNTDTGLPIIASIDQYNQLNKYLMKTNILLIIKFHPAQDMTIITVCNMDNILLLSPEDIKKYKIDNYKLLTQTDALISDYSSISFDYLLLNRPIAFMLGDYRDYRLGFSVENYKDFMPGKFIYNYEDILSFIEEVKTEEDDYKEQRVNIKDIVAKYNDGNCCKKIIEFFNINY